MKKLVQTEELLQMAVALAGLYFLPIHLSWWLWIILFFAPDISMIGYAVNPKVGGALYNLFHHKGTAALLFLTALVLNNPALQAAALILWAHCCFDRSLGYGLKYLNGFANTHLGKIGASPESE